MSTLAPPEFGAWMPWMMRRWPKLTRHLVEHIAHASDAPWRATYEARSRQALTHLGIHSADIERAVFRLPAQFMADALLLRHANEDAVRSLPAYWTGTPQTRLAEAMREGRGVVLGCSNFGCFYQALLACRGLIDDILIVIGHVASGEQSFRTRLEHLTGARIRLVPVDTRSTFAIARQLKNGGVVATMLDTCLPGSPSLIAPFLGRPATSPAGLYQLVSRQGAVIFPVFTLRRLDGLEIKLGEAIDGFFLTPPAVAEGVNVQIGQQILEEPGQWMMWPALLDRWKAAAAAAADCVG